MSKANEKARALFSKQKDKKKADFKEAFEVRSKPKTPLDAFLETDKLSETEEKQIENLVSVRYKTRQVKKSQVKADVESLLNLSSQIRSITKQSLILHGERVAKGQEILKKYKRGAFSAWLEFTYGNRQTPYNFLYYYNLYRELPTQIKPFYQKIPYKAAYLLGAREGSLEKKIKVIEGNYKAKAKDLLVLIDKLFPLGRGKHEKNESKLKLLDSILINLEVLKVRRESWNSEEKKKLKKISRLLAALESSSMK
ncbi:MAG: CT583 family protein [Chlamydiota bacterium]